jgi:UPF0271 protein
MLRIDLNCDMGEGFADDDALLSYVTSANIACGLHAGSPGLMQDTVKMAMAKGVAIGAHPGFDDRSNFGRTEMELSSSEAHQLVKSQIVTLDRIVVASGGKMHHVKPHGALYNMAAKDEALAKAIAQAVFDFDASLILYGLAGSEMIKAAKQLGLATAAEVFADRTYQDDGSLTSRKLENALITDESQAIEQVMMMVREQKVISVNGNTIPLRAETLCLHGDGAHAVKFARLTNQRLKQENIAISAPGI